MLVSEFQSKSKMYRVNAGDKLVQECDNGC